MIDIGLAEAIDLNLAIVAQFHADLVEAQTFGVGDTAHGEEDQIGLFLVAVGHLHEIAALIAGLDVFEGRVEAELDALHRTDLKQPVAHGLVIAAQQAVAAIDDMNITAEFVENACEFIGNIAAARNDDLLRQFVEMEGVVRTDRVLRALAFGHARPRARGNEDMFRRYLLAACQRDLVRTRNLGPFLEDRDIMAFERVGIGPFEPVHIGQHVVAQDLPVELALADFPAEFLAVFQILGEMGTVDEHLLRHAAANDAGAADPVFFRDRHFRAMRCRNTAGPNAPRPSADGEKVVIVFGGFARGGHAALLSGSGNCVPC